MTLIPDSNIQAREGRLFEAFDEPFRCSLEVHRDELKKLIEEWASLTTKIDGRIDNVFDVQSRIKEIDTFREKIHRKNYIIKWPVYDSVEENQKTICSRLPDLIGIRVNCYFANYESVLYRQLLADLQDHKIPDIDEVKEENNKQKNGHEIYKLSGRYKKTYHFEIQIKSIVHNVWGEVEHKTIYKNPCYDGYVEKKKELSEALHEVLFASDNQLLSIFQMNESENTLIQALFYIYTKDIIEESCRTKILANHYENYFNSFDHIEIIKDFVSKKMSNQPFEQEIVEIGELTEKEKKVLLFVNQLFPRFYTNCLFQIDSVLHSHESYDTFMKYFMKHVIKIEEDDVFPDGSFADGDEEQPSINGEEIKDYLLAINGKLGMCVEDDDIKRMIIE